MVPPASLRMRGVRRDSNHKGYAAKRCVTVGLLNRSERLPVRILQMTVRSGYRTCEALRLEMPPCSADGRWQPESCTVLVVMGEPPLGHRFGARLWWRST